MLLWFWACGGPDGLSDAGSIDGSLAIDGYDVEVEILVAYGYDDGSEGVFDFPSNPEASCADVVALQNNHKVSKSDKIVPDEVLEGGTCRLFFNGPLSEGAGSFSGSDEEPSLEGFWTLDCPLGEGSFEWENRDGDKDYYWTGDRLTANPVDWSTTVVPEREGFRVEVAMDGVTGNYIDSLAELSGEGSLSGGLWVSPCSGMSESPWL